MATTSDNVTAAESIEHDMSMPEDFFQGIKGAHYSQCGKYITGYAESFKELQTVVDQHAQVGAGEGWGGGIQMWGIWTINLTYTVLPWKIIFQAFVMSSFHGYTIIIWIGVCCQECITVLVMQPHALVSGDNT